MAQAKAINLALQGGGAHGAFTWGVLDRLLEDGQLTFEAISGTSAGAMNAVVVADGFVLGGQDGARAALDRFWRAVAGAASLSPLQRNPFNRLFGDWSLDNSPGYLFFDVLSRLASPYELNPLNLNPLRDLLEAQVDFGRVEACNQIKLFLTATNVHTGRARVFKNEEITADAVLASACLPFLFQAIEIDGVPYWDGGYLGNPALWPFFNACSSEDVVLVQINPLERQETPKTARDILNRLNEITFNASLMKELRSIEFVSRLINSGTLDAADYKQIRLHRIHDDEAITQFSASSKLNAEWDFLCHLKELGRQAADRWIRQSLSAVGQRSTVDINALFR